MIVTQYTSSASPNTSSQSPTPGQALPDFLRSSKFFTKSQADCSFSRMLSLTYVGDWMVGREGMEVGRGMGKNVKVGRMGLFL